MRNNRQAARKPAVELRLFRGESNGKPKRRERCEKRVILWEGLMYSSANLRPSIEWTVRKTSTKPTKHRTERLYYEFWQIAIHDCIAADGVDPDWW